MRYITGAELLAYLRKLLAKRSLRPPDLGENEVAPDSVCGDTGHGVDELQIRSWVGKTRVIEVC